MSVKELANNEQFPVELTNAGSKLVVVDMTASWCGPCQMIAPFFKQLATKYPGVVFLKCDVDKCEAVAQANRVSAMPTFIFFKNSVEIERIRGADKQKLEDKVKEHSAATSTATTAATGGAGASADAQADSQLPAGFMDLNEMISKGECECLNQCDDNTWENILNNSTKTYLKSDCDEQLLLVITFNQTIKLHSLIIQGPEDNGPKTVKLFINQTRTLDFDSAEKMEPIQQLDLKPEDLKDNTLINLRFVKFQNVQSLTLFFGNNQSGSDSTVINYIKFIGAPISTTNMSDFKRVSGQPGEAHG